IEDVGAPEKERPLLGKEQRKACQIRPARVDFRLREVRVHRQRTEDVRADPLSDVEAGLTIRFDARVGRWLSSSTANRGTNFATQSEIEGGKPGEQPGSTHLIDCEVAHRARPA